MTTPRDDKNTRCRRSRHSAPLRATLLQRIQLVITITLCTTACTTSCFESSQLSCCCCVPTWWQQQQQQLHFFIGWKWPRLVGRRREKGGTRDGLDVDVDDDNNNNSSRRGARKGCFSSPSPLLLNPSPSHFYSSFFLFFFVWFNSNYVIERTAVVQRLVRQI